MIERLFLDSLVVLAVLYVWPIFCELALRAYVEALHLLS